MLFLMKEQKNVEAIEMVIMSVNSLLERGFP